MTNGVGKLERYIIGGAIAAIIIFLIWFFSNIVFYILIAAVLSLMGKPLVDALGRINYRGVTIPKWLSATITISLMWIVAYVLASMFVPLVYGKIQSFASSGMDNYMSSLDGPIGELKSFLYTKFNYNTNLSSEALLAEIHSRINAIIDSSIDNVTAAIDFVTSAFVALFSITFIAFFFMKEDKLFNEGVIMLFPQKYEASVDDALSSSIKLLSKYFIGLTIESTIKIIIITISLYLLGLDFGTSFLIALISGVLNVIPYIGPLIGAGIGMLIAASATVASVDIESLMLNMIIVFSLFQLFDNIILQPYIYSNSVKAHPLEIFLVILIAGSIAGVLGMLLAIPAYTVIRLFAKVFFSRLMVVQKLTKQI